MTDLVPQRYERAVKLDRLTEHPRNPRQGDVGEISQSIAANGFYGAVIAQTSTGQVLAGNHRLKAARAMGLSTLPVVWVDVDDDTALRILLADNRTSDLAAYDDHLLAELLAEVATSDATLQGTAWSGDDLDALLYDLASGGWSSDSALLGDTPSERRATYEAAAIKSLVLPVPAADYNGILEDLTTLRNDMAAPSNAAVVVALIRDRLAR